MVSFQPHLASLLKSLPPTPVDEAKLNDLVSDKLEETKNFSTPEIRKAQWEYALKDDIFALAVGLKYAYATRCSSLPYSMRFRQQKEQHSSRVQKHIMTDCASD